MGGARERSRFAAPRRARSGEEQVSVNNALLASIGSNVAAVKSVDRIDKTCHADNGAEDACSDSLSTFKPDRLIADIDSDLPGAEGHEPRDDQPQRD